MLSKYVRGKNIIQNCKNMDWFLCFILLWFLCVIITVIESAKCRFVVVAKIWNKLGNYCNNAEKNDEMSAVLET